MLPASKRRKFSEGAEFPTQPAESLGSILANFTQNHPLKVLEGDKGGRIDFSGDGACVRCITILVFKTIPQLLSFHFVQYLTIWSEPSPRTLIAALRRSQQQPLSDLLQPLTPHNVR